MRLLARPRAVLAALCFAVLAACSSNPNPPVGRWEGVHEDSGLIVVTRLEIDAKGEIRVSAPNAMTDLSAMSEADRSSLRSRLISDLARSWPSVKRIALEFDGKAFRKPGGVAPQLEWDAKDQRMTMIFYSGNRASVRVPLDPVERFRDS